jgi:hypothetical protein
MTNKSPVTKGAPDHAVGRQYYYFLGIREEFGKWFELGIVIQRGFAGQQEHITNCVKKRTKQGEKSCDSKGGEEMFHDD